ncbi:MAG: alpha-amylase family glycosyl hydrolase [Isosphaeraceae bacterium]
MSGVVEKRASDRRSDEADGAFPGRARSPVRRYPIGAEIVVRGGVNFRVAAPNHCEVHVVLEAGPGAPAEITLAAEDVGYFAGIAPDAAAGSRYRFRLGGKDGVLLPDPASRYQHYGPAGPSEVVDATLFRWTDRDWRGVESVEGHVLYELHIATFTREGTWATVEEHLEYLAGLGVTVLEIMPLAEFAGKFGWGYDGVNLFAPYHGYGTPDDVRRFVDRAHALGLAVILDVVYNHFGVDSSLLKPYAEECFTNQHVTDWGEAVNFDGPGCRLVREFVLTNVAYWVEEFHFDGMRVDATQAYFDTSPEHVLKVIPRRIREAAGDRGVLVVGENEPQSARLLRGEDRGGLGLGATRLTATFA